MTAMTLFLSVVAAWAALHTLAMSMRHQSDVAELNKRVKVLRDDYLSRSKSKRAGREAVLEVGEAEPLHHAA